jgi:multiple sugar transport system substrate-binding protein
MYGAGNAPDVEEFFNTDFAELAARGALAPLPSGYSTSGYSTQALQSGKFLGKLYAIPWGFAVKSLYYRRDFFKEAGIASPPKTWAQLEADALKLTKRNSSGDITRVGFWVDANDSAQYKTFDNWFTLTLCAGGSLYSKAGKADFASPAGIEAAAFLNKLLNSDKVDRVGAITDDSTDLVNGEVAMELSNSAVSGVPGKDSSFIGVALPPTINGARPAILEGGHVLAVSSQARDKTAAFEFLHYLTTNVGALISHEQVESLLPLYQPALSSPYIKGNVWNRIFVAQLPWAVGYPTSGNYSQVQTDAVNALNDIYLKDAPVASTLRSAQQQVQALGPGTE